MDGPHLHIELRLKRRALNYIPILCWLVNYLLSTQNPRQILQEPGYQSQLGKSVTGLPKPSLIVLKQGGHSCPIKRSIPVLRAKDKRRPERTAFTGVLRIRCAT